MPPIFQAQITFAFAALAAGVTPKALRNWLDRALVILDGDDARESGEWRRFSLVDVVRLAVVARLVAYGVSVSDADEICRESVMHKVRRLQRVGNAPPAAIVAHLTNEFVIVSHHAGGGHDVKVITTLEAPRLPPGCTDAVILDLGRVAQLVLERLGAIDAR